MSEEIKFTDMRLSRHATLPEMRVVVSDNVMTEQRAFPASRHRSARIRKKLLKRFGYETRSVSGCVIVGNTMYVHPEVEKVLRAKIAERINTSVEQIFYGAFAAFPGSPI